MPKELEQVKDALKPCPFCGDKGKLKFTMDGSSQTITHFCHCIDCGVQAESFVNKKYNFDTRGWDKCDSENLAIKAWNTRAIPKEQSND